MGLVGLLAAISGVMQSSQIMAGSPTKAVGWVQSICILFSPTFAHRPAESHFEVARAVLSPKVFTTNFDQM
jgi:hypothetical protein